MSGRAGMTCAHCAGSCSGTRTCVECGNRPLCEDCYREALNPPAPALTRMPIVTGVADGNPGNGLRPFAAVAAERVELPPAAGQRPVSHLRLIARQHDLNRVISGSES